MCVQSSAVAYSAKICCVAEQLQCAAPAKLSHHRPALVSANQRSNGFGSAHTTQGDARSKTREGSQEGQNDSTANRMQHIGARLFCDG